MDCRKQGDRPGMVTHCVGRLPAVDGYDEIEEMRVVGVFKMRVPVMGGVQISGGGLCRPPPGGTGRGRALGGSGDARTAG